MAQWPSLRDVIARHGLDARRSLGQHFLLDGNLTDRIVRHAGPLAGRHVLEIGPGPGGLTRSLLRSDAAQVTAIEIDTRAIAALDPLQDDSAKQLIIRQGDAMRCDLTEYVPTPRQVIANLPYNVATPLLIKLLRQAAQWEQFTLMFQLEVAERITAHSGDKAYGRLSILVNWLCQTRLAMRVSPIAFTPPPKVWSAITVLRPRPCQPDAILFEAMERLTAAAFGQRRKMLRGSLKSLGGTTLLDRAGIDPALRAEALTIADFDRLARLM